MKNKFSSMQMRLTLLTTAITAVACIVLMAGSIASMGQQFTAERIMPATLLEPPIGSTSVISYPEPALATTPAINALDAAKRDYKIQSLLATMAIVLAASVLTYLLVGRFMRPINDMVKTVEKMDENNLSIRLADNATYGELTTLSDSFNSLAQRLEESFESKRQFIANAAHELKTPLASLQTNIEVFELSEQHSKEEYAELTGVISRQTKRLIHLSEELLDSNPGELQDRQSYPLRAAMGDIVKELGHAAEERGIHLTVQTGDIHISGYPSLLNRLFTNLLDNAIKYSEAGGRVDVTATEDAESVTVSVADSGAGIPLAQREKIFEPFYRIDKSRSRSIGGAGLGLSICKMAAEKHDAVIVVGDREGGGAVICVRFPKVVK